MKLGISRIAALIVMGLGLPTRLPAQDLVASAPRAEITLNGNWQYILNQPQSPIPTTGWSMTRVPAVPLTDGTSSVWYQQTFFVPASWNQSGRRFFLKLEKAGHYSAIYCNGTFIFDNFGQYSPFEVEVTKSVLFGQNNQFQIYVHKADTTYVRRGANINQSLCPVNNPDCIGNSYRPGTETDLERNWVGLAGDVTLSWRPSAYVSDVFVVTSVRNSTIQANLQVAGAASGTTAQATVLDGTTPVLTLPAVPVTGGVATLLSSWTNPVMWGPVPYGQPKLYTLETNLLKNGLIADTIYTQFGFREVWVQGTEVFLNGQKLWMIGNFFTPLSDIRYINDRRSLAFTLWVMENSGSNTMQHHWDDPGDPWLQLADEMGILVVGSFYCNGNLPEAQVDSASAWTDFMVSTATAWTRARRNHPSLVIWRPVDNFPTGASRASADPQIASAVQAADPSNRPIADGLLPSVPGLNIDAWGQAINVPGNLQQCDDLDGYADQLAGETKPLLIKEVHGNFGLSCAPTFWNTLYTDAYTGGGVGFTSLVSIFNSTSFSPSWFSISGVGNRPTSVTGVPNWINRTWTPTPYATQFAGFYKSFFQPNLLNTSPLSGDYQASGLASAAAQTAAFLLPSSGLGEPVGVLIAQDGSGTAWFVTPQTGAYQLLYNNGSKDVVQNVTVSAPPPF